MTEKNKKSKSPQKDDTGEEISDVRYYSYIDAQFLWGAEQSINVKTCRIH